MKRTCGPVVISLISDDEDEIVITSSSSSAKKSKRHHTPGGSSSTSRRRPIPPGFYLSKLRQESSSAQPKSCPELALSDIITSSVEKCILINYMYDLQWLFQVECPYLFALKIPTLVIHGQVSTPSCDPSSIESQLGPQRQLQQLQVLRPDLPIPYGTHHTKMALAFYSTGVRIAIFTANFIPTDWQDKTQGIWSQDFPLLGSTSSKESDDSTFRRDLFQYLEAYHDPRITRCLKVLSKYDFSSANVDLVASVPGYHKGPEAMKQFGHLKLRSIVGNNAKSKKNTTVIAQASSLGSLTEDWLEREFFSQSLGAGASCRIIWPTQENVRLSNEGWTAGGSIPCALRNMKPFLRPRLYRWSPPTGLHREHVMPHIKSYTSIDASQDRINWILLTSANLSKAAWGTMQKRNTQLMIRSYEMGVLFRPSTYAPPRFSCDDRASSFQLCRSPVSSWQFRTWTGNHPEKELDVVRFPLPFENLAQMKPYRHEDVPWVWDQPIFKPDRFEYFHQGYGQCTKS